MPKKFIIKKAIKKSKSLRKSVRVEIPRDPLITQLRIMRQMKEAKASWVQVANIQKKSLTKLTSKLKPLSSSPPSGKMGGKAGVTSRAVKGTKGRRLGSKLGSQVSHMGPTQMDAKLINQLKQLHKVDPKTGKRLFDAKTPYQRPQRKLGRKVKWGAGLVGGAVTAAAAKMRANKRRRKNTRRSI